MTTLINPESASIAWRRLLTDVFTFGENSSPRGIQTREVLGYTSFVDMQRPILLSTERRLSYEFMAAEAYWILSGRTDVEFISKFAPSHSRFSDNGTSYFGAYGSQFIEQVDYVVEALLRDNDSRQAVMTIWRQRPAKSKDVPCTVALQWLIREDQLHCVCSMRSSDAWLGWPYDIFTFSMMSALIRTRIFLQTLIADFKLELGTLILTAGSQHLYAKNDERAMKCVRLGDIPKVDQVSVNPGPQFLEQLRYWAEGASRMNSSFDGRVIGYAEPILRELQKAKDSLQ